MNGTTSPTSSPKEKRDPDDREKVLVRLTPRALHELYIEVKDLDVETRQMGHRAECDLCGEMVDMDRAIPNQRGEPCHKHCWAEYTGAPDWFCRSRIAGQDLSR
jgi:formylmethanofuran dehydrogenase subunit E